MSIWGQLMSNNEFLHTLQNATQDANCILNTRAIIVDLDGTLADCSHRIHLIEDRQNPNWDGFYLACVDDAPIHHTIAVVNALKNQGHTVYIMTGRSDLVETETHRWLLQNVVQFDFLIMRRHGDYTHDCDLKQSWFHHYFRDPAQVLMAFEDRDRVVKMWRDLGIPCFQVADGAF